MPEQIDDGLESCIAIQPETRNGVMPYPYFVIESDGAIGRQDYWKGRPTKLIGFSDEAGTAAVELSFEAFVDRPADAVGKYPVFEHADGQWYTAETWIESIRRTRTRRMPLTVKALPELAAEQKG
jgi:hypothetical protein